ncbi:MAG: hypothetical protein RRB13_01530 [bacterium]|nr:hypothetical protein [bacterium]
MLTPIVDWLKSWVPPQVVTVATDPEMPQGLVPLDLSAGDPRQLNLASAREFVDQLRPDGLANLSFEAMGKPPRSIQRALKAGLMQWTDKGLVLVMRKDSNRFDINFADLWTKLKQLGIGETKKMLVDNHILWSWKWETDGAVCNLSYWTYLDHKRDEGLRFSCAPRML